MALSGPDSAPLRRLYGLLPPLLPGAAFLLSPEAGLGAGLLVLPWVLLRSPERERDAGLLLLVLGAGILLSVRSLLPGLGVLVGALYLLGRSRWMRVRGEERPRRRPSLLWSHGLLYELVTALAAVALIVALLQQGLAAWPAMVAVESCSMEPNVRVGDLVLVVGTRRTPVVTQEGQRVEAGGGPSPDGSTVSVTWVEEANHRSFARSPGCIAERPDSAGCAARGEPLAGDVIVFYPNGNRACTPIIHRARAWVDDNSSYGGRAFSHAGFITKGDNNGPRAGDDPVRAADQVARGGTPACPNTEPVRPEWMVGVAKFRIPWVGYVRLLLTPQSWPKGCATGE